MKHHVLFVDDGPSVLEGLRRMLHNHRGRRDMAFVTSVDEAVECVDSRILDAIVSDVHASREKRLRSPQNRHSLFRVQSRAGDHDGARQPAGSEAASLGGRGDGSLQQTARPDDLIVRTCSAIRLKTCQDEIRGQNATLERGGMERAQALNASRLDLIWRLGRVAELRDEQTGTHVVGVGSYCRVMAEALGMGRDFADTICFTRLLHDIGEIGIPDDILLQPRKLTPKEWDIVRRHCVIGADILRRDVWRASPMLVPSLVGLPDRNTGGAYPFLVMAASIALTHHEWWDGTG